MSSISGTSRHPRGSQTGQAPRETQRPAGQVVTRRPVRPRLETLVRDAHCEVPDLSPQSPSVSEG
eukprot:835578-Pyramimonas_sp.AAC.1